MAAAAAAAVAATHEADAQRSSRVCSWPSSWGPAALAGVAGVSTSQQPAPGGTRSCVDALLALTGSSTGTANAALPQSGADVVAAPRTPDRSDDAASSVATTLDDEDEPVPGAESSAAAERRKQRRLERERARQAAESRAAAPACFVGIGIPSCFRSAPKPAARPPPPPAGAPPLGKSSGGASPARAWRSQQQGQVTYRYQN